MTELDPQAITFTEMYKQQVAFIDSKPDSVAWRDRYMHSSGTIELDLNSITVAHLERRVLFERREVYKRECKKISSAIAMAQFDGYSVARPKNARVRIKVLPNQTKTFEKFEEVAILKDTFLLALEQQTITDDELTYIDCIVGELKTATLTLPDSELALMRFYDQNVTDDIKVLIDNGSGNIDVEYSQHQKEMSDDKFCVMTNPYTSVDMQYLNETDGRYYYTTGSIVTLEYIEANNLNYLLTNAQVVFSYGTFYPEVSEPEEEETQTLLPYQPIESIISIIYNSALYSEAQGEIRAREDFRKNFKLLGAGLLVDTGGRDFSPADVQLTYLVNDHRLFTQEEKDNYILLLNNMANYGIKMQTIIDPIEVNYRFTITLKRYSGSDIAIVPDAINEIFAFTHKDNFPPDEDNRIAYREDKLEHSLNLNQLEHELVRIQNRSSKVNPIQIARVDIYTVVRANSTLYNRGDFITPATPNGKIYECIISGKTDSSPPTFNTTAGSYTFEGIVEWTDANAYVEGDIVLPTDFTTYPYLFKCVTAGTSGDTEPLWTKNPSLDIQTADEDVRWQAYYPLDIPYEESVLDPYIVWKCHLPIVRELPVGWNEYISLNYGDALTWQ